MSLDDSVESLQERLQILERELESRNQHTRQLERVNHDLSVRIRELTENAQPTTELSELEETLRRMMTRITMILQASKCLFMIHEPEVNELRAQKPAIGLDDEELRHFRFDASQGISGECFRENQPIILYDAESDERVVVKNLVDLGIKNGICVPLVVEKRDEETNKVLHRRTIGVLWVFNKKFGNIFIEEDIQLLDRMAKNTAAIINNASTYRRVVEEKEELVETIQALTAGLVMIARSGRVTQMNASAREIFGIPSDEAMSGRTYDQVIRDEKVCGILRRGLSEEHGVNEEIQIAEANDPESIHTFQIQSALVRNDTGELIGMAAIFNDITDLKNIDKMKTAFVSTVSHELRTPLTSIKGFISTLVQDTEGFYDTETRHEFYTIIDTECDRLRRLIDDLLSVSRIESGKALSMDITEFDIHDVLPHVLAIADGSTYKRPDHTLALSLGEDVPHKIWGDRDKVEQIFHNLISNALKYAPNGGEVRISGKVMPGGELIQFAVSDQGLGMTREQAARMGERFYRIDNRDTRKIGGTGIGLFLVKNFVNMHGGRMWVESEPGKGSTFFFTLAIRTEEPTDGELAMNVAG
jgi:two-component system phosphate regulon sensor histidine kinase PhoR